MARLDSAILWLCTDQIIIITFHDIRIIWLYYEGNGVWSGVFHLFVHSLFSMMSAVFVSDKSEFEFWMSMWTHGQGSIFAVCWCDIPITYAPSQRPVKRMPKSCPKWNLTKSRLIAFSVYSRGMQINPLGYYYIWYGNCMLYCKSEKQNKIACVVCAHAGMCCTIIIQK